MARGIFGDRIDYAPTASTRSPGPNALAILTEWTEFREPDFARMQDLMRSPVIFDGRNLFDVAQMRAKGFAYHSIGR